MKFMTTVKLLKLEKGEAKYGYVEIENMDGGHADIFLNLLSDDKEAQDILFEMLKHSGNNLSILSCAKFQADAVMSLKDSGFLVILLANMDDPNKAYLVSTGDNIQTIKKTLPSWVKIYEKTLSELISQNDCHITDNAEEILARPIVLSKEDFREITEDEKARDKPLLSEILKKKRGLLTPQKETEKRRTQRSRQEVTEAEAKARRTQWEAVDARRTQAALKKKGENYES
jgi:hypothetical protein